jgi:hypothetical protein
LPVPTQINGLPAHVLLIHIIIGAVLLAALLVVLHALWPAARRRLGIVTPLVALGALVCVPITTHAGNWFKHYLLSSGRATGAWRDRIVKHANLGGTFLWFAIALFVVAAGLWFLGRRYEYGLVRDRGANDEARHDVPNAGGGQSTATAVRVQPRAGVRTTLPTWANAAIGVVSVAIAVITVVQLYRIGDSGAQAVWHGSIPGG